MPEIERLAGFITKVKGKDVYSPPLPDWSLSYVEIDDDMPELRRLLMAARARIVKVTDQRIYFEG